MCWQAGTFEAYCRANGSCGHVLIVTFPSLIRGDTTGELRRINNFLYVLGCWF